MCVDYANTVSHLSITDLSTLDFSVCRGTEYQSLVDTEGLLLYYAAFSESEQLLSATPMY